MASLPPSAHSCRSAFRNCCLLKVINKYNASIQIVNRIYSNVRVSIEILAVHSRVAATITIIRLCARENRRGRARRSSHRIGYTKIQRFSCVPRGQLKKIKWTSRHARLATHTDACTTNLVCTRTGLRRRGFAPAAYALLLVLSYVLQQPLIRVYPFIENRIFKYKYLEN